MSAVSACGASTFVRSVDPGRVLGEPIVKKVLALTVCCGGGGAARRIFECGAAEDDEMWVPGLLTRAT